MCECSRNLRVRTILKTRRGELTELITNIKIWIFYQK